MPSLLDIFWTLVCFLPQVFVLYFVLEAITESGILRSRSLLSVLLGFGCTTLAVCSLSNIPNERKRRRMAVLLSFVPCSAMLPLLLLILTTALRVSFWWIFAVYILSVGIGLLTYLIGGRRAGRTEREPKRKISFPNLWNVTVQSVIKTLSFTKKIFIAFILSAFVITVLARFTFDFHYTAKSENSILFYICGVLSPIFAPVGLNNPAIVCALIFGLIAKESAVSVLLLFPQIIAGLTPAAAVSLIIFYALYPVCVSCCIAVSTHCGKRTTRNLFALNMAAAYIFSFIAYAICGIMFK